MTEIILLAPSLAQQHCKFKKEKNKYKIMPKISWRYFKMISNLTVLEGYSNRQKSHTDTPKEPSKENPQKRDNGEQQEQDEGDGYGK